MKKIIALILKVMDALDPSGTNSERYKNMFKTMSNKQFMKFMKQIKNGEAQLYVEFPNLKLQIKMENIYKAADITKTELFQKIWMTDPVTEERVLSNEKYLIANVPIRRMQQTIFKKLSVPSGDSKTDTLTRQVMGDDQSSSLSNPEAQMLHAKGLDTTLTELMKVRGGDPVAYSEFKRQLEEVGSVNLTEVMKTPSNAATVRLVDSLFRGMNLDSNFTE